MTTTTSISPAPRTALDRPILRVPPDTVVVTMGSTSAWAVTWIGAAGPIVTDTPMPAPTSIWENAATVRLSVLGGPLPTVPASPQPVTATMARPTTSPIGRRIPHPPQRSSA